MLKNKLLAATGNSEEPLYSDSVFSAFTYTGNGATQTITNGIDLAGKGGLVWTKCRSVATNNSLVDTVRGANKVLDSELTSAQTTYADITAFNSNGYSISNVSGWVNTSPRTYASWTFRRSPKFFDVVSWTGNGAANRDISHSLGISPGFVIARETGNTSNWYCYHRSNTLGTLIYLNLTNALSGGGNTDYFGGTGPTAPSASTLTIGGSLNGNGLTYIAYLFAHDTSTAGIIQCGSFTTDGSGDATVSLGWEPQYLMIKASSAVEGWNVSDTACGYSVTGARYLSPNTSAAEGSFTGSENGHRPTATGFVTTVLPPSTTYIYLAIRRPNKPPTTGTQVYSAIARTGTGAAATVTGVGFAPDLVMANHRAVGTAGFVDRLRGVTKSITPSSTGIEATSTSDRDITALTPDGITVGTDQNYSVNTAATNYINHFFKRAPGVFDQVCWTGAGSATPIEHGLGVKPELVITKSRNNASIWYVNIPDTANTLRLNVNVAWEVASARTASSSTFVPIIFNSGYTFVAYLFASKAGISKVGSYTGNATTNTINCGFTTGARFVLIKRTDSTGDWYVWDTVRGIIAGNDPYLLLNSTAAEVTSTDYIDPVSTGFEISSTAPAAINASGGTFIYLAFA